MLPPPIQWTADASCFRPVRPSVSACPEKVDFWLDAVKTHDCPRSTERTFLLSGAVLLRLRFVVLMTDTRRVKCCIIIIIFSRKLRHDERVSMRLLNRAWAENLGDIWRRLWNLLSVPANFRFDTAFQRYLAARELCWWEPLGWLTIRAIISSIIFWPPHRELLPIIIIIIIVFNPGDLYYLE